MMVPYRTDPSRSVQLLEFVGLGELQDVPARGLSYGQQKLLEFARALVASPEFVLPDEGAVHLKPFDVVIQRGTNHAWVNRGSEPAVLAGVLIDAGPV